MFMQDNSTNEFFDFVRSPTSFACQLSERVNEMQLYWKETNDYDQQPDEVSRWKSLKVVWFTFFEVTASIFLEAGEASVAEI